ncbi:DMT family transporter [Dethiosulfatarculus sandiegensis]|uniref:Transporter n=1 Tax=Dethiosulfatarculus sandiegensis TaxID=1429043 RepID=A0A0D2HWS6_9BACT|nr:DMT family transporter [Dethiosulfatarculus sandiegensis]KIX14828.1 transporter [Dethiosulfatarculus sandiegensis]
MNNLILYVSTVFIWGSTWLGIKYQLGVVDPMVSVVYRFGLSSLLLLAYCYAGKKRLKFSRSEHAFMALMGVLLFSINYWLIYVAELYITSGLAAVVFSTILVMNILNGILILKTPFSLKVALGGGLGLLGISLVFWPEIMAFDLNDNGFLGLLFAVAATFLASLGNITSARNQKHGLPVLQTNAFGMAYGTVLMTIWAVFAGKEFTFVWSAAYVGSLLYLAVFGSIVAFGCYLTLVGRMGADRAAYATLLFPLVALGLSTIFEDYKWTPQALSGLCLTLGGNFLILNKKPAILKARSQKVAGKI